MHRNTLIEFLLLGKKIYAVSTQCGKKNKSGTAIASTCYCDTKQYIVYLHFFYLYLHYMSHLMRKPTICICENKGADQLCGNREADQRLCFRYTDSTMPLLSKSKISSFLPSSVLVQPG